MEKSEIILITKILDDQAQHTQEFIDLAMKDVRRTIAVAAAHTDGRIDELNKTIKDHNSRLKITEDKVEKQGKIISVIKWTGKHWYIPLSAIIILILILIPLVEILGLKGLLALIK